MLHLQWSTLVFQLLNFFILLLVLGRFLYRPLMDAMQRREEAVAARVRDAEERATRADAERAQLAEASRAARAEAEALLARAHAEAAHVGEAEHARARQEAARLLEEARQRIADEERAARRRLSEAARASAVRIAGSLLGKVAGRPFHEALVARLLDGGLGLDAEQADLLRRALDHAGREVIVETAYPMQAEAMSRLEEVLGKTLTGGANSVRVTVRVEPSLTAGLRLVVGVGAIDLSLKRVLADLDRGDADAPGS
jgi:F-type H+-transporting ATPase subunit b